MENFPFIATVRCYDKFENLALKEANCVMPDLIRHPVTHWIPAFAGMTIIGMFGCMSNS